MAIRKPSSSTATKTLHTIEGLVVENSRLKKELEQAIAKFAPPSYISQDVARDCIDILKSLGAGRKRVYTNEKGEGAPSTELRDMVLELRDLYQRLYSDIQVFKEEYEFVVSKTKMIEAALHGVEVQEDKLTLIYDQMGTVKRAKHLRAVLEMVAIRLERLQDREPELKGLHTDITAYLEKGKAEYGKREKRKPEKASALFDPGEFI